MWPFSKSIPTKELAALQADMRTLRLEWEDTYERVLHALRRLSKRAQDAKEKDGVPERVDPRMPVGLDEKSAAIWRRRLTRGGEGVPTHG